MNWKKRFRQLTAPRWKRRGIRALAWTLAFALLVPSKDFVLAYDEPPPKDGICVHHPQHTVECGYIEASEGSLCTHTHDGDCGFAEPSEEVPCDLGCAETDETGSIVHAPACAYAPAAEGSPCAHAHDGDCGYSEPSEGAPCGYVCALCVTGWQWNDDGLLVFNRDANLWVLGVPGASTANLVTRELLSELLPGTVTAVTAAGEQTVELIWDLGELPEEGAYEGAYTLTAALSGEYVLTEAAPALEVLLELGGGETYAANRALNDCRFIELPNTAITKNEAGIWSMDLYVFSDSSSAQLKETVPYALPSLIYGRGYSDANDGGFTYDPDGERVDSGPSKWGTLKIVWNRIPDNMTIGNTYSLIPSAESSAYNWILNAGLGSGTLQLNVTLHPIDAKEHIVTPANPENVTVNLFDYWVTTKLPTTATNGDILDKSDWHIRPNADSKGNLTSGATNTPYSTVQNWNQGINQGHLLLFGDGLIHAGLWNKGAGESTIYGNTYAGMEGIVKKVLAGGYPEINLAAAKNQLTEGPAYRDYTLVRDYQLAGTEEPILGTNTNGNPYEGTDIQNLSANVLNTWGGSLETSTESLQYLFDPNTPDSHKTSYTDVTGLFQLDSDGYYYYNMRENFAELVEEKGSNHFLLYDAPATVRTDGQKSIGNFFPFNKGSEVFNGIDENGKLTSSVACSNNSMNHHLGMTVEVEFRQPLNGRINTGNNAQPMTFGFSGDDDVWVFIDDVLVLDLGGIHSEIYGTIDFSTGDVYIGRAFGVNGVPKNPADPSILVTHTNLKALYEQAEMQDSTKWNGNTFASNTSHTLKMFYLERGNYDSSIALRFNLQPLLYQQLMKVDQSGEPVSGVTFELYPAEKTTDTSAVECLYTDTDTEGGRTFYVKQSAGDSKPLVTLITKADGSAQFLQGDGAYFNFADRGPQYYILREINAPDGYRKQPVDIVLHYDPDTAMLSVANRWTTGAYACSVAHVTGPFVPQQGSDQENGLVVAVPLMKKKSNGGWLALYGSNLGGFQSVPAGSENDVLLAALYQAQSGDADWHLDWDAANSRLKGTVSDLPGLANRYTLIDPVNGDMQMAYGLISAAALAKLGIHEADARARYAALRNYLKTHTPEEARTAMAGGFQCLKTDTFNRDFRSLIYIPNEQRELRVLKINQNGEPMGGARFGLYAVGTNALAASGVTDADGMLVFSPTGNSNIEGQAQMTWADSTPSDTPQYYLKEIAAPAGYDLNPTEIPVIVGIYSIYADAGTADDGVLVMAGVGRLTQTMRQYAIGGDVDITLQDITAFMQCQPSSGFSLTGWRDAKLVSTPVLRSMNLHYGKNNDDFHLVDYGLHDEDGGEIYKPFFVADTGFVRAQVQQMEENGRYENVNKDANRDSLGETDLTNLFSLLNVVVVTDRPNPEPPENTVQLTVSKKVSGPGLTEADYTRSYHFVVTLTDAVGVPLPGEFYFYGKDRWGYISSGQTLLLHHDESVTILGLPEGTRFTVTETDPLPDNWHVTPGQTLSGTAGEANAEFTNTTEKPPEEPPKDPEEPPTDPETPPRDPEIPPKDPETPPENPETPPDEPETPPGNPETPPDEPETPPENPETPPEEPETPPENPETPPEEPEEPSEDTDEVDSEPPEEHLTELPDPNDPNSPDEITIWEDGIPTTYVKWWDPEAEEWVYIPEDELPLMNADPDPESGIPDTGDGSVFWLFAGGASLTGLTAIKKLRKKEEEED